MAEDPQQRKSDLCAPPSTKHQPMTEDLPGQSCHQSMPSQISKEKLYQKRQKCELRRLLKHTHPELKRLDDVVDEELADVLSLDTSVTTGETGYEGEVLSRRLIFENCASSDRVSPYPYPKKHVAEGTEERDSNSKSPAVLEHHKDKSCNDSAKGIVVDAKTQSPDPSTECEEETVDFHAARRMFESQCGNISKVNTVNKSQENTSLPRAEAVQNKRQKCRKENFSSEKRSKYLTDPPLIQRPCLPVADREVPWNVEINNDETSFEEDPKRIPDPEQSEEIIKTRDILLINNPFISTNIEREKSLVDVSKTQSPVGDSEATQDCVITNVKDRAHLFESMPFDKIRQQNKDEVETMVENIKETLNSLYQVNAIISGGSIIEVNETMIAKKAKFTLSDIGPLVNYEEVAEGGTQNFLLQLLPRANLKPQIKYIKEDCKGRMETTKVNVPVHQHQFTNREDTEFKTANVAQVVEDILIQDNSLRKGVIIQEDVDRCSEVVVYSLYYYFDEEDVKSYCSPQGAQYNEVVEVKGDGTKMKNKESIRGTAESTIGHLQEQIREDQTSSETIRPVKGNVKLFKSCIEKGDLEYLKSLQTATEQEQELSTDQNVSGQDTDNDNEQRADEIQEGATEWVPVDVKRLKHMFSQDQRPVLPKQSTSKSPAQSTNLPCAFVGHSNIEKTPSSQQCNTGVLHQGQSRSTSHEGGAETPKEVCNPTVAPSGSHLDLWMQDDDRVHQAELVEVVDDDDEITNLQNAIHSLQQATIEAKSWQQSLMEKQKITAPETSNDPVVSVEPGDVKYLRTESELSQENKQQRAHSCTRLSQDEFSSAFNMTPKEQSVRQNKNAENWSKDSTSGEAMGCSQTVEKDTELVQKSVVTAPASEAVEQSDEEVVFEGKLQAALDSLERSNINVTRGDFRAAMIYKNASKPHRETSQQADAGSVQKPTLEESSLTTEPQSSPAPVREKVSQEHMTPADAGQSENLKNNNNSSAVTDIGRRPVGPKPAIPPKPERLKVKQKDITSKGTTKTGPVAPQPLPRLSLSRKDEPKQDFKMSSHENSRPTSADPQSNKLLVESLQETELRHQVHGSVKALQSEQETNVITDGTRFENLSVTHNKAETAEKQVEGSKSKKVFAMKTVPVKPKRVKTAQPDKKNPQLTPEDQNSSTLTQAALTSPSSKDTNSNIDTTYRQDKSQKEFNQESKVEMREKKGRAETEDERRQRLSVHMDEIVRGNITAAMEIFDNLRKQEELQSILCRVEEIENDTSQVDVSSLRQVYESVPDWVVSSNKKKQKKVKVQNKEERVPVTQEITESKSSMAHVFGDLERASEEIMNLKEQTLARLLDIEGAIKKALLSVSTLRSESDIAGLSCLFKESLGTVDGATSSGNISTISIGSSKTKSPPTKENTETQANAVEVSHCAKPRVSPPSSPAFISIQSAARKSEVLPVEAKVCPACQHTPKTDETFRTTKTLTCNSPAQTRKQDPRKGGQKQSPQSPFSPKRELSVLEVQTDRDGNSVVGTKTVTENYERTDNFGNRFYSSKTSIIPAQPGTSTAQGGVSPAVFEVTKYPDVQLPISQKH
ncbi:uncharacterized protein V6R79_003403 [Siganus canaliculatus]